MTIRSLDDAIRLAKALDGEVAAFVSDWTEVGRFLDDAGIREWAHFEQWLAANPPGGLTIASLLSIRFATPALGALWRIDDSDDLAAINQAYRRALENLGEGVRQALRGYLEQDLRIDFEAPVDIDREYVRAVWLHRPRREMPLAVTLLLPVGRGRTTIPAQARDAARYRAIVEDQTDFIVRYRPDGVRTFVNRAYADFFGGTPEELVGESFFPLIPEEHRPAIETKIRRLVERRAEVLTEEHLAIRRDGVACWTHWVDRAIFDADGNLVELQAVGRDISDQKESEAKRRELEQRLSQAQKMEALGTMAGGLAHDFNNTLTVIAGYAGMIRRGNSGPEETVDFAQGILLSVERAADLVRNLLQLSRRAPTRLADCNVKVTVEAAGRLLRAALPARITVAIEALPVPTIQCDEGQLTQAIVNLVFNARDAISGQGRVDIVTGVERVNGESCVFVRVHDNGHGIPEDLVPRLFEPFFTTKPSGEGSGLGLSMVYAFATGHGGTIGVESSEGRGTTFTLRLPVVEPTESTTGVPRGAPSGRGQTILLVDDDPLVALLNRMTLQREGYVVLVARNGEDALLQFDEHHGEIPLVITDLLMPGGSGLELEAALHERRPRLPIILLSGSLIEAPVQGFAAVLEKPTSPEDLVRIVSSLLTDSASTPRVSQPPTAPSSS